MKAKIPNIEYPWYVHIPDIALETLLGGMHVEYREGHTAHFRDRRQSGAAIYACINSDEELEQFRKTADVLCHNSTTRINRAGMALQRALRTPEAEIFDYGRERLRGVAAPTISKPRPDGTD